MPYPPGRENGSESPNLIAESALLPVKVAFIVPVKNESANIDLVLDTVLSQAGIEPEIVIVDNGSTDDTVWRASKRRVKIVRCSGRVSDCRMAGVAATDASTIFFIDADQRLEPETCKRSLRELEDPSVTAVVIPERPYEPRTWLERLTGAEREIFEASGRGIPRIFRRSRYLEIGGHPTGVPFGEDYALLAKLKPEEIRIADAVIYHQEVRHLAALLKKYFGYGKRMAGAPPVESIFTNHAGTFLAQVGRHALRSPFSAFGALAAKGAKLAAIRLGYTVALLEVQASPEKSPRPSLRQWSRFAGVAFLIPLVMNWRLIATPGILIVGDHVSPRPDYWRHILGAWDQFEHGGTANANLSDSPYFLILGLLGKVLGVGFADKALILLFFSVSILAATLLLVRVLRFGITGSFLLGVFYAFNPWTAARFASGHTQILMGYALLPLIVLLWQGSSKRSLFVAAFCIAVEMSLNLQIAVVALVALVAFGRANGRFWPGVRDGAICAALAGGMSLWWILPLLGTHGGSTGHTGLENVLSYTQMTDVVHTATLRSYWWPAFSDALYRYGNLPADVCVVLGMAAIVAAEVAMLLSWRWLSRIGRIGVGLWFAVSLLLVLAHTFPQAYWQMLRVPFATLFRDPDKLVALSVLGFVVGVADLMRHFTWKDRVAVPIACAAIACITLPWWGSGNLRGNVQPQVVRDGSLEASAWISKQTGSGLVLWWPDGPYIRYRWYPAGGQDPMRYWSTDPMLNPYYDPAYDPSPGTSDFLYALEANVPKGNLPYLGALLSTYGIRYVAVRNSASTSFTDFPNYRSEFAAIGDLKRVETFRDTDVYENLSWQPGHNIIGHYAAMVTGDFTPMLSLVPQLSSSEVFFGDGLPTDASYEYVDIDRQLERGLVTYRYESNAPYTVAFASDAQPSRGPVTLAVSCPACDVLLVKTNAVSPRIAVNGANANPAILYADLPNWQPRWRAYNVGSARTVSITTGDPNAYVYEAVLASRRDLDAAMLKSFDEVRHHWPTYVAGAAGLDMHSLGTGLTSDKLGPIVETDSRKWRASVIGRGLSSADLTFYWWNGGERQKVVKLTCAQTMCGGDVLLNKGFARVALASNRTNGIQGFILSSGRPPAFDNSRVDQIPARMDADTKLFLPNSYNAGWHLSCTDGPVLPRVGNDWATLYATGRVVFGCTSHYSPEALERIGALISLLVLAAVASAMLLAGRLPLSLSRSRGRAGVTEPPAQHQ